MTIESGVSGETRPDPATFPDNAGRVVAWLLVVAGIGLILTGCWYNPPAPPLPDGVGAVALTVQMISHLEEADRLHIVLRQGGLVLEHTLPIVEGRVEDTWDGVYTGRWEAVFEVWDREGFLTHRGQSEITVLKDESTPLHIVLDPLPGLLRLRADLAGFSAADRVERARLHLQPGDLRFETIRSGTETTLPWEREVPPGTYDVQVALFGPSFHNYNLIYAGPWFSIDILPGRTLEATWHPATGRLHVTGEVRGLPSAPRDVTVRRDGHHVVLEWVTTSTRAVETVIWWSTSPLDRPVELARLPTIPAGPEGGVGETYRHRPADDGATPGSRLLYAVSTVDDLGRHSLRVAADPLSWNGGPEDR